MGFSSIWHWIIVLVVILLLFGAGKIPRLMGDVAKGVKAFKKGLQDDEDGTAEDTAQARKALEDDKAPGAASASTAASAKDEAPKA